MFCVILMMSWTLSVIKFFLQPISQKVQIFIDEV
ncbi:hypothetical protein N474_11315 [Pseudoalteromonas luteoviolacea CPMOR-2]|uniref:Uncharacterized protein n=1 Tax=Pseudoalteromonas luteoviolacea DSM 6061 TaxID=1365250 RepID=A0A166V8L0_9GAMM|nr:hypothetical protein N475_22060 [Pseudoalteromonas luteoviolacea DSM 6061]KZN56734.1 hypothetical protein N474_11315 [Pseudoalteromonas luteoviolacea CPMOR-2]